jgi:pullulanase/glycogen debranching enzyme
MDLDDEEMGGDGEMGGEKTWPLTWRSLLPRERWVWFEQLWADVLELRERYRLPVRSGWWESDLQVEALAAFASAIAKYDSGDWDDDALGKLNLLAEGMERLGTLLADGPEPFHPDRDRVAYARHVVEARGAQLPPNYEPEPIRKES